MSNIYADIARRTGGSIYIGVVGPVRTGKSTCIKRLMETLVIPNIEDVYQRERARDELPQSGSGRTIMTAEPKFIPEEAVEICPDGTSRLSVRFIDSVGYMVEGAAGATEDGAPRMVTTPWFPQEIPMTQAAELGTRKVMEEHCTVGLLVTTDGSVTEIPRQDYLEAEARAIEDLKATGKPFGVVVNSRNPRSPETQALCRELEERAGVRVLGADCQAMEEETCRALLQELLYAFPMEELRIFLPPWVQALEGENPLKTALYRNLLEAAEGIVRLSDAGPALKQVGEMEEITGWRMEDTDLGRGVITCTLELGEELFYEILGEKTGFRIRNNGELLTLLTDLSRVKARYDRLAGALEEVQATGYGVVLPEVEEMHLEVPEMIRKGGAYGVRLRASAPSIHLMRADISTEISPMVGDERQSQELVTYLLGEYEGSTEKLWESNIFGKSVFDLVSEGLTSKLRRMPEEVRFKMKDTLTRIVNEGARGLICLML